MTVVNPAQKVEATNKFNAAMRRGELVRPDTCEHCGDKPKPPKRGIQAHHDDYTKPLDVQWLCQPCHSKADVERRRRELDEWAAQRPVYLTVREVAKILQVTTQVVYQRIAEYDIPAIDVGTKKARRYLISQDALKTWLKKRARPYTPKGA